MFESVKGLECELDIVCMFQPDTVEAEAGECVRVLHAVEQRAEGFGEEVMTTKQGDSVEVRGGEKVRKDFVIEGAVGEVGDIDRLDVGKGLSVLNDAGKCFRVLVGERKVSCVGGDGVGISDGDKLVDGGEKEEKRSNPAVGR